MQIWIKTLGLLFVVFCGIKLGYQKSVLLTKRVQVLQDMILFLQQVQNSLKYRCTETVEALQNAQHLCAFQVLALQFDTLTVQNLPEKMQELLQNEKNATEKLVAKQHFTLFEDALLHLGQSSVLEENEKLQYAITLLHSAQMNAQEQCNRDAKLVRLLGLSGGVSVALLLL